MAGGDFWDRLRGLYAPPIRRSPTPRQPSLIPSPQQPAAQPVQQQVGPLDYQQKVSLIHEAGRALKMLEITYDGVDRLVEPYSFRQRHTGLLFFGHCSIHDRIHSFKIEKIEKIRVSEFSFGPRWDVEL